MANRNKTASWIHYPLPQPATVPTAQGDMQQVTWNFRITVSGILVAVPGTRILLVGLVTNTGA